MDKKEFLEMTRNKEFYKDGKDVPDEVIKLIKWAKSKGYIENISVNTTLGGQHIISINNNYGITVEGEDYLESLGKTEPIKIEITNHKELADEISRALGIDRTVIDKILEHQTEIKEILEELTFISADSLVIAKEHLLKLRKDNSEVKIDGIIGVISNLVSIVSVFK